MPHVHFFVKADLHKVEDMHESQLSEASLGEYARDWIWDNLDYGWNVLQEGEKIDIQKEEPALYKVITRNGTFFSIGKNEQEAKMNFTISFPSEKIRSIEKYEEKAISAMDF